MGVTEELFRLGKAARRLNDGSDRLDRSLAEIDRALATLMLGFEYTLPRPIAERSHLDRDGKRVIEVSYLGYLEVGGIEGEPGELHLAIKTLKVFEGRRTEDEAPGRVAALLESPRALRHAAVDHLAALVAGLSSQVNEMVENIERRNEIADMVLGMFGDKG